MEFMRKRKDAMKAEDWKAMYMILLHAISDVVEDGEQFTKQEILDILTTASLKAEDHYINVSDAAPGRTEDNHKNLG